MPDLEERAVVKFGLSLSEFWDSTPRELEMLIKGKSYQQELEMNKVRHLMAATLNTIPRKKGSKPVKPQELMPLPLIDGEALEKKAVAVVEGQKRAEKGLAFFKKKE